MSPKGLSRVQPEGDDAVIAVSAWHVTGSGDRCSMIDVALTRVERREAADMIKRLLDLVDDGSLAADGPGGVALVRRLEGAMITLMAMDGDDLDSHRKRE